MQPFGGGKGGGPSFKHLTLPFSYFVSCGCGCITDTLVSYSRRDSPVRIEYISHAHSAPRKGKEKFEIYSVVYYTNTITA